MNKHYFLILFLFAIGTVTAQKKEVLSKEEKARREKNVQAGNPFIKYGSKAPVATLSKGKYLEVHDLDSIVTIGTMRWHVDKKEIVGRIVRDTLNPDAQPIGDTAGRWMSPDPLTEEFPTWSPYNFCYNNPVRFKDPDGRAAVVGDGDFEPTKEGNLRVEKGDTPEKLRQQYGVAVTDKNFKFKEGNIIMLDNNMTRSITESSKTKELTTETDTYYNCHGAAKTVVQGEEINQQTTERKSSLFQSDTNDFATDITFKSSFKEISSVKDAKFGKTVLAFGDEHSAVFYGKDSKGTEYYYSKNGFEKPAIYTKQELMQIYTVKPTLLNYEPPKKN